MMMYYLRVVVIITMIMAIQGQVRHHLRKENYLRDYMKKWSSGYLPDNVNWDTPCGRAMKKFNDAITSFKLQDAWALTMVDSWGKSNDGFWFGVPFVLGSYDQCLRTTGANNTIRGKYCTIIRGLPIHEDGYSVAQNLPREWVGDRLRWTSQDGHSIGQPIQRRGQGIDQLMTEVPYEFLHRWRQPLMYNGLFKEIKKHAVNNIKNHQSNGSVRMGKIPIFHPYRFLSYGTCMPHACTKEQLQNSLWPHWVMSCDEPDWDISFDALDIGFVCVLGIIAGLMLAATATHGYILYTKQEHLAKGPLRFLLPFAVSLNLKKVFTINTRPAPGTISCLNGMRVMSMCWVIYGHQNLFTLFALENQNYLYRADTFLFQIVNNAMVSVDSFFFMSGLLVCYGVMREMKKTGRLNIIMYYVHRIIRLTPPIAMAVWYFCTLNRFTGRGPIPFSESPKPTWLASYCRDVGWKDFTYVSNIAFANNQSIPEGCLGQCWYTSVDTQLYVLAPLLLLPLYYFKTIGRVWTYLVTLAAIVMRGFITWNQRNVTEGVDNPWMYDNYFSTWTRADSWLIGIWTGYFIVNMGKKKLELKPWQVVTGWTVAVVVALLVMFGRYHSQYVGAPYIMYEMMHRTIWASCLAWVTIACYYGYGGVVNHFLSHPSWQPFSRLTYPMYLVAMQFSSNYVSTSRILFYFTHTNMIISTCGILFISTIFALCLSLTVEAPILGLEKQLLKRPDRGVEAAADNKASATPSPNNQVAAAPIGSEKDFPVTGHDNVAFEPSEKDGIPLEDMSGKHSEAMTAQMEPYHQASAYSLQPPSNGEVIPSDSQTSNLDCDEVPVGTTDSVQFQGFTGTQVTVEVEQHSVDPSS